MAAGLTMKALAALAAADYHDTTDAADVLGSEHDGCPCRHWGTVSDFAVRMLTGQLEESVLDAEVGVVVVDLDDLTEDPTTGTGPAPGHPETIPKPVVQLTIHGEVHTNPDNPDAYHVHTSGIVVKNHHWMNSAHALSLLADAMTELTQQEADGSGVQLP